MYQISNFWWFSENLKNKNTVKREINEEYIGLYHRKEETTTYKKYHSGER